MTPDTTKKQKVVFRIVDNIGDEAAPYALVDPTDTVIRVHNKRSVLVDIAFDKGADLVEHDEDLVKAEERFQ